MSISTKGKFPSLKMGQMIPHASAIERDCIYLMDYGRDVTTIKAQPFAIPYRHNGKKRKYTPDFYMVEGDTHFVIECKHHSKISKSDNQLKFEVGRQWCRENRMVYRVITDKLLYTGYRFQNVVELTTYARYIVNDAVKAAVMAIMLQRPQMLIRDLMIALCPDKPQSAITPILHLLYHHKLFISLDDAPITPQSVISLQPIGAAYSILPPEV